jgi:DNA adenine methylase
MREWRRQRRVYEQRETADLPELGFAALFLNRTNRSGIINGGVIGGHGQTGKWGIDARFNKPEIVQRIQRIARYRSRISIYQMDAREFTKHTLPGLGRNTFAFFDPPYIESGEDLYMNDYTLSDHRKLAQQVSRIKHPWVMTYDHAAIKHDILPAHRSIVYGLKYTAQDRYKGREVMFLSDSLSLPRGWTTSKKITLSSPHSRYPFYGRFMSPKP